VLDLNQDPAMFAVEVLWALVERMACRMEMAGLHPIN